MSGFVWGDALPAHRGAVSVPLTGSSGPAVSEAWAAKETFGLVAQCHRALNRSARLARIGR